MLGEWAQSNTEPPGHRGDQVLLIPKVLNPGHIRLGKFLAADPEYLFADNFLAVSIPPDG